MARRGVLWTAFALVHVIVAVLGHILPNQPMGDTYLVYEPWAARAAQGIGIMGVTEPWVYPPLALVPMLAAYALSSIVGYTVGWTLVVTALDAAAFSVLLGSGRSRTRIAGAWFWLAFSLLLGPIGMYRIDAITVPLAVVGVLWLAGRPWLASALLAAAVWIKVWPAALLLAAVTALRNRLAVVGGALGVSVAIGALVLVSGGAAHLFGFVGAQTGRGLQLEAPASMIYVWQSVAGVDGAFIYYDPDMLTFQVAGAGVDALIAAMTPLLVFAVTAIAVLGAVQAARGASFAALFPPLSLALVTALIAFNKVGSPQFLAWLIAPLLLWIVLDRSRAWPLALLGLSAAALTQLVYPVTYGLLLVADPVAVALLTVRNAMMVALFIWAVVRVTRVRAPGRTGLSTGRSA